MAGTKAGAAKAVKKIRAEQGEDFWRRIGKMGGLVKGKPSGFAANDNARTFGRLGGAVSRRGDANKLTESQKQAILERVREDIRLDRGDYQAEIERDNRERMARMAARFK